MSAGESTAPDIGGAWAGPVVLEGEPGELGESVGAGVLPMLPPRSRVCLRRTSPMWAKGQVAIIELGDEPTISLAHLADIQRYHGGGTYELRAQAAGKWVKGGVAKHEIDGEPLDKGNPHPNNPRLAAQKVSTAVRTQVGPYGSPPPLPPGADPMTQVANTMQWMMGRIEQLENRGPIGGPPPGFQAPPGYQLVPTNVQQQTYVKPADAFTDVEKLVKLMHLVRELDGRGGEDEYEDEEPEPDNIVDGVPMPQNLEEAASAYVWLQMKESEQKKLAEQNANQTQAPPPPGPRLIKSGESAAASTTSEATPAPGDTPATGPGPVDLAAAMGQLESLPAEQQAGLLMQLTHKLTANPEVQAAMQKQVQEAMLQKQGGPGAA